QKHSRVGKFCFNGRRRHDHDDTGPCKANLLPAESGRCNYVGELDGLARRARLDNLSKVYGAAPEYLASPRTRLDGRQLETCGLLFGGRHLAIQPNQYERPEAEGMFPSVRFCDLIAAI